MKNYLPPKVHNAKEAAARRARIVSTLIWLAAVPPLIFGLMVFGYSDQAPAFLRSATIMLDAAFGSPVWTLLKP
jgi:hypothetical protein